MGYLNNISFLKAYKKIENVIQNRSVLSNKDTDDRNKINTKQEYIDELNKDKIFLIVKTKNLKKNLLVPLISEDRYNSDKELANERTISMITKALEKRTNIERFGLQIDPQDNKQQDNKDKKQLEKVTEIIKKIRIKKNLSIDFTDAEKSKYIKDKIQLEKAIKTIKKIRIEKNSGIDFTLKKRGDKYNPLDEKEKAIALKITFAKVKPKTGKFIETLGFMQGLGRRRCSNIYKQFNEFWNIKFRYLQTSESYYGIHKINEKAICPVFIDKESADQFRIDGCKFPIEEKKMCELENHLKPYNKSLKKQENEIQNLLVQINELEKIQNFKIYLLKKSFKLEEDFQKISIEITEKPLSILNRLENDINAELASVESLTKTNIKAELASIKSETMLGIKSLQDKTKLNNYLDKSRSKIIKKLLKLTEKTLKVEKNSLRARIKNINSTQKMLDRYRSFLSIKEKKQENSKALFSTSQYLSELKPLKSIKIISVGLGDFIQYYSSISRSKSLEKVEFLFIPTIKEVERKEVENSNSIKNLVIESHKKLNDLISTYELEGKTFKDYQIEYFSKSE